MRLTAATILFGTLASISFARDVAPPGPPRPQLLGQVIDPQQPAVVPKFLSQRCVPAGLAERQAAIQFTYPSFGYFGYGGFGYGGFGCGGIGFFGGNNFRAPGASIEGSNGLP